MKTVTHKILSLALALAALAFNLSVIHEAQAASWVTTGPMTANRAAHTATLLPNGKVLVAGGGGTNSTAVSSAELYDPANGTWTATGVMTTNRSSHTATLLPNGKVLVAGGNGGNNVLSNAEVYIPGSGTWTATGAMTTNRFSHTATLLSNGKVLIAGGNGLNNVPLASTELYDPSTGMWSATGAMTTERASHTATLLPNGKVLVAGGGTNSAALSSAELYDPASGTWTATGAMTTNRSSHTATLLPNGKVLIAGGNDLTIVSLASTELYNPNTGAWTATGTMTVPRAYHHTATLLTNGTVLVAGGGGPYTAWGWFPCYDKWSLFWVSWSSAELYNPSSGTWMSTAAMTTNRSYHTATLLPNGKVLVAGGGDLSPIGLPPCAAFTSTELYDPTETEFLYFDNFQQFPNGTDLTTGNYTPASGPAGATAEFMLNSGLVTVTASNFLGSTMAFVDASVTTNKGFYDAELAQAYVAPVVSVTWKLWIQALKPATSLGGFMADLFVTNNFATSPQHNPIVMFNDSGLIWTPTNQVALGNLVTIGNWSNYVGQVMTNTLVLNFPKRAFSFAINGNLVTNMPIDLMFTNLFGKFAFAETEQFPQSAGNRFAFDDVRIVLLSTEATITAIQKAGADMRISFLTLPGQLYDVERRDDLVGGTWFAFTNNINGTGGIVTIPDSGAAALPKRFYRVGAQP